MITLIRIWLYQLIILTSIFCTAQSKYCYGTIYCQCYNLGENDPTVYEKLFFCRRPSVAQSTILKLEVVQNVLHIDIECPPNVIIEDYDILIANSDEYSYRDAKVNIRQCPTPYVSFREIFDIFSMRNTVKEFTFSADKSLANSKPFTFESFQFANVTSLKVLNVSNNYVRKLPEELFSLGDMSNLETLHLNGNRLRNLPPKIFEPMKNLKVLSISDNSVPFEIYQFANLISLTVLNLSNSNIESLPQGLFVNIPNLETLKLDGNRLRSFPKNLFEPLNNLKFLNMSNNLISSLDKNGFQNLTKLEVLILNRNKLDNLSKMTFTGLTELKSLDLSNNAMMILNEGIFDDLKNLKHLYLYANKLMRVPEKLFANNINLIEICFNNAFDRFNFKIPGKIFHNLASLRILQMGWNNLKFFPEELFQFQIQNNTEMVLELGGNAYSLRFYNRTYPKWTNLKLLKTGDLFPDGIPVRHPDDMLYKILR